ncbi:MAG: nitroreductase family protein [Planctomycetota bacterium]|nr:nitroreductase family protein [Planctomycetota bacterium]
MSKHATPDHPIHELLSKRWSPYVFADRPVAPADLNSLFEAARWAASSYNEQPWRFIVAARGQDAAFKKLLGCLVEANQAWARQAPVLALGVFARTFQRNGKPNKAAAHDLGLAAASLTFEATARGLCVHQMIGIDPEQARAAYSIPEDHEAFTALAIGYPGDPAQAPEALRGRDTAPRARKPLAEFVFGESWGVAADLAR